jgi:WD40 repeat protein
MRELRIPRGGVTQLAYTQDGRALLGGDTMGWVRWWDLGTGTARKLFRVRTRKPSAVEALTVSRDARLIAAGSYESLVLCRWGRGAGNPIPPSGDDGVLRGECLSLSPDGRLLAARTGGWGVALWDVDERARARIQPEAGSDGLFRAVAFSPEGQTLAGGTHRGGKTIVWDVTTGRQITELLQNDHLEVVAFSPRGDLLATGSAHAVRLWHTSPWQYLNTITLREAYGLRLALHPSGSLLCTACGTPDVTLWDTRTTAEVGRFDWQIGKVLSVAFAPDGMTAAAGGSSGRIVIWDVEDVPS